jgi:hypothetical protein
VIGCFPLATWVACLWGDPTTTYLERPNGRRRLEMDIASWPPADLRSTYASGATGTARFG